MPNLLKKVYQPEFDEFLVAHPGLIEFRDPPHVHFLDETLGMFPQSVMARCRQHPETSGRSQFQVFDYVASERADEAASESAEEYP